MRIGLLWARYGPYHFARLNGAASVAGQRGFDVQGFELASNDDIYEWEHVQPDGAGVTTIFPGRSYETIPAREIRGAVGRTLDDSDCDVVAVNGWSVPEARAGIEWAQSRRSRRAVLMSETKRDDSRRRWWKEWLKRRIVARCDAALVGGRKQAEYLIELGFARERVFLGYDTVDNAYFEAGADAARKDADSLRRRYELPGRYFVVCTRFLPRKNVDGLLRAYRSYRQVHREDAWHLVILGSGEESGRLRRLKDQLGLQGVSWPGFVQYKDLPVYYGLASAFIHPAKSEPWGLVVNEAAASGLPLLVSRTVGARYELVADNDNGYLFDPYDPEDMARAMGAVTRSSQGERERMAAVSRKTVRQWSPHRFGAQLCTAAELAFSLPDR